MECPIRGGRRQPRRDQTEQVKQDVAVRRDQAQQDAERLRERAEADGMTQPAASEEAGFYRPR